MAMFRIGIDLGGTKIEAAALDDRRSPCIGAGGSRPRSAIMPARSPRSALLIGRIEGEIGPAASVGIGIPGTLVAEHRARQERQFGVAERAASRARCRGGARPAGAFCQRRQLLCPVRGGRRRGRGLRHRVRGHSRHRVRRRHRCRRPGARRRQCDCRRMGPQSRCRAAGAGEEWPGPPCYCGRTGCIETFLSGPGLAADHRRHAGQLLTDRRSMGRRSSPARRPAIRHAERRSTAMPSGSPAGLAGVINILDPDAIVLGGGLSDDAPPLRGCAAALGAPYYFRHDRDPAAAADARRFERGAWRGLAMAAGGSRVIAVLCRDCSALDTVERAAGALPRLRLAAPRRACRTGRSRDRPHRLRRLLRDGREARPA